MPTSIMLDTQDVEWRAEAFQSGITMCFQHGADIHIQSLTFNGRKVFDHRVPKGWSPLRHLRDLEQLPAIPELKPVTLKVAQLSAPEFTKGGGA